MQVIGIGTLSVSSLNTNAFATATGAAGNLTINTRELLVRDGGQVSAGTWGPLKGGNLTVRADSVQVIGGTSDLRSSLNTQAFATATGAAGDLSINTRELLVRDGGEVSASTYGAGKGGNIDITAGSLFITNGGLLNASTSGQGDAGSVNINARDTVSFNRSGAYSTVQNGAVGKGGNINITTRSLSLTDGAFLNSSTFGRGDAGSVTIQASGPVSFNGVNSTGQSSFVSSTVESGAVGNGGSINIKAGSLSLTDGANIQTLVRGASYHNKLSPGRGNAGNVSIDVRDAVTIAGINKKIGYFGGIVSSVSPGAVGDGGSINIKAGSFSLTDGGTLSADTLGQGEGGNINLDVKGAILLSGGSTAFDTGESTRITLGVIPGAIGSGGDLYIKASSLVMTDGAIVKDSTQGQGNAGNIYVDADVVDISGSVPSNGLPSGLFTSTTTNGRAGDIIINTQTFRIADGAALSARSKGDGQAGNIRVNASSFEATNGGQLVTTTFGKGQAGNILINATDRVSISGSDPNYSNRIAKFPSPINPSVANDITETGATSGLFANTEPNSTAQGGGIKITTGQLVVQNRAEVTVNSAGLGNAGSLTVNANSIKLDTQGKLAGTTASGRGGDIRLDVQDFILMRNNSAIATTAAKNGSGGNITINSPFIVAVPDENSDIVANAEHGPGGKIEINATGIYGLEERTKLSEDPKISEINASSEFGANGTVELNTPDVDLSRGFVNLPAVPVDTKVAQGCTAGGSQAQSEFIITGRGGLPPNPGDALSTDAVQVDLITLNPEVDQPSTTAVSTNPTSPTPARIVEATGWVIDADGNVVLTANASTVTPHNSWQKTADCRAFNQQPGG
ncbi:beta strand repeat-containing protein [Scytonema sp. PRP1]|uniref:beta strand repeat-containing protein n=1 Tax=Scytonema sp. PRP1 TaxID=3120513 RepID=UPI00300CA944